MDMDGPAAHRMEPPGHVEIEDLAVLAEGRLPEEDCARVRAHLAECGDCYEVFADMVRFLEEEGAAAEQDKGPDRAEIKRFPFFDRSGGFVRRWLPAAAAAVLVLVGWIGYRSLSGPPRVTVAGVARYLPTDITQGQLVPQDVYRGPEQRDPLPFRIGVELVDLQAALRSGDVELAKDAADDVALLFAENRFYEDFYAYYSTLSQSLSAEELPRRAADSERYADQEMRGWFESEELTHLDFGIWAEAARLAAVGREPGFFSDSANRRALARFARNEEISRETRDRLRALQEVWEAPEYDALGAQLQEIVRAEYGRDS